MYDFRSHFPALRAAQAWGTERDREQTMAQVCSAAERVLPPGVLGRATEKNIYIYGMVSGVEYKKVRGEIKDHFHTHFTRVLI